MISSHVRKPEQGPHYFVEEGKRIDSYPLESFEGKAAIIDLVKKGVDTTSSDLKELLLKSMSQDVTHVNNVKNSTSPINYLDR